MAWPMFGRINVITGTTSATIGTTTTHAQDGVRILRN